MAGKLRMADFGSPVAPRLIDTVTDEGQFSMRALELDPLSPQIVGNLAYVYLVMRRYDESIAQHQKALDLDPNAAWIRVDMAGVYALKGAYAQAIAEYDKIPEQAKVVSAENQFVANRLGWVYAVSGRRADALKIAKELKIYLRTIMSISIKLQRFMRDSATKTSRLLEKGYEEHSASMPSLAVDPFWYGMRSDPRYADLLRRMGLPQPN